MRLHIKFFWAQHENKNAGANQKSGNVLESFLILADDLPTFARMVHIMNMTNGSETQNTKYLIRMESTPAGAPSLSLQKTLLEPFRYLYTREGKCTFRPLQHESRSQLCKTTYTTHPCLVSMVILEEYTY